MLVHGPTCSFLTAIALGGRSHVGMFVRLAAVFLVLVCFAREAHACKCGDPATKVSRPELAADSSQVRVRYDDIEIRCEDRALKRCTWRQSHHLENDGDAIAHVTGRLGAGLREVRARVQYGGDPAVDPELEETLDPDAVAFEVSPQAKVTVVIEGRVSFGSESCGCWATGLARRHPVVSRDADVEMELDYVTEVGLPETSLTNVSMSVEYPGPARIRGSFRHQSRRFRTSSLGGGRLRSSANFSDEEIAIFLARPNAFARGGPFVAVGGGWGTRHPLRLRAGYELGAPRWLVHSLAVETDTSDVRLVPAMQAMSGHAFFPLLPAGAIGVGVPIDIHPRPRVGMRAQIDLSWYVVTFVAAADYFPAQGRNPWAGSLFAQFSF